jgi:hypothetical protein
VSLDYALREEPKADHAICFPSPCPIHPQGDEGRLAFRSGGWIGRCEVPKCKRTPVWNKSFLCGALFVERFCAKHLPLELEKLTK